jgi:hypothetical protein
MDIYNFLQIVNFLERNLFNFILLHFIDSILLVIAQVWVLYFFYFDLVSIV